MCKPICWATQSVKKAGRTKSSGPIHVYKGKNISAAGKLGDYILFINTFMKGMAASTIIHVDGKKYMPDTMYTIGRDGKVYEKE